MDSEEKGGEPQRIFGDEYDVMQTGFIVHGKDIRKLLNEDFIVSDLSENERIYIRRGLRITYHIKAFLDVDRLMDAKEEKIDGDPYKHFNVTEDEAKKVKAEAEKIVSRMLKNYKAIAILSRGKNGRMIKALIELTSRGSKRVTIEEEGINKIAPDRAMPS